MPPKKRKADDGESGTEKKAKKAGGGSVFSGETAITGRAMLTLICVAGLTFCLSGTLSQKKADVEKTIKSNGGKVASSVTAAVTHVIAADPSTGKAETAKAKGELSAELV